MPLSLTSAPKAQTTRDGEAKSFAQVQMREYQVAMPRVIVRARSQPTSHLPTNRSFYPFPNDALYGASKHAVLGLCKSMGPKIFDEGITIK